MKILYIAFFTLCLCVSACAGKKKDNPPSPLPDAEVVIETDESVLRQSATQPENQVEKVEKAQMLLVYETGMDEGQPARNNEPHELKELLEVKNGAPKGESAVSQMRPAAIREAAQLATFQKAMSWRYGQLVNETGKYANIMDAAFNFSPLLLTQGEALIMPPMLAKGGASMRIEDGDTATSAKATYELIEPARYISSLPHGGNSSWWTAFQRLRSQIRPFCPGIRKKGLSGARPCARHGTRARNRPTSFTRTMLPA